MWTTTVPSRFLDELPEADVEVKEAQGGAGGFGMGGYGASRFDEMNFGSNYTTPGWKRAQQRKRGGDEDGFDETGAPRPRRDFSGGAPRSGRGGFSERKQIEYVPDEDAGTYDSTDRQVYEDDAGIPPRSAGRVAGEAGRVGSGSRGRAKRRTPLTIEGELVAKSTGIASQFSVGDRVFHQKFGNGIVTLVDGNKLTIRFDKAGEKRVVDSFVERV
jgi:DNA helicase-2/ATP-dependent DNA helicase PcrA